MDLSIISKLTVAVFSGREREWMNAVKLKNRVKVNTCISSYVLYSNYACYCANYICFNWQKLLVYLQPEDLYLLKKQIAENDYSIYKCSVNSRNSLFVQEGPRLRPSSMGHLVDHVIHASPSLPVFSNHKSASSTQANSISLESTP